MRTEQEIKQLAIDIVEGKVFGTWNLNHPEEVGMVFMTVMFLDSKQRKKLETDNVVHFYEYISKATPRSVNGMPVFFSMHCITKTELDILQPLIDQLKEEKKAFLTT